MSVLWRYTSRPPPDVPQFFMIEIVVFNPAHAITALVRGANAQRILRVVCQMYSYPARNLIGSQAYRQDDHPVVVGHDAIHGVTRVDHVGPGDLVRIDAIDGRLIGLRQTLSPQ